jgi:hypothetical protein
MDQQEEDEDDRAEVDRSDTEASLRHNTKI